MAHLFGLLPADFVGKNDEDLYGQWIGSHLKERDSRVLAGESVEVEHTRSIAGTPITFHDITIPIRNSAGEIVGVCGLSVNITDRKQLAGNVRELRRAGKGFDALDRRTARAFLDRSRTSRYRHHTVRFPDSKSLTDVTLRRHACSCG